MQPTSIIITTIITLLSQAKTVPAGHGIASMYRPWEKSKTVPHGRYAGNWSVKPTPADLVCAHRTLPFWTILKLTSSRTAKHAYCFVVDRGPFGFCDTSSSGKDARCKKGGRYVVAVKRGGRSGYYRGVVDATPAVHEMMGTQQWAAVRVERLVGLVRVKRVLRRSASGRL